MTKNRPGESRKSGTAFHGFINYSFDLEALDRLKGYEEKRKTTNREP